MNHLLASLMRDEHPGVLFTVLVIALLNNLLAAQILRIRAATRARNFAIVSVFGVVFASMSWFAFRAALSGKYPNLNVAVPLSATLTAILLSLLTAMIVGALQRHARRSARNAMFGGSLLASGVSTMIFTGMAAVVRPFALAYDLSAVLTTLAIGSTLFGFALWESGNPRLRRPWLVGSALATLAMFVLVVGSLASILPFGGWMTAVSAPDDLASSPIVIIVAAEAVSVLAFSLFGSLVDQRNAAREQREVDRFRQLADCTLEGIVIHRDGRVLDCNASLSRLLGIDIDIIRRAGMDRFVAADTDQHLWSSDAGLVGEAEIVAADGTRIPVEIVTRAILHGGRPACATALRDVRERRASEEKIRFLAHHDVLTALPNRARLQERLDLALRMAGKTGESVAVMCLDLDGFKLVNDTLGHAAGDELLRRVAGRIRDNLRDSDFVARIGGDEFVILQTAVAQPAQSEALARRIGELISEEFLIEGQQVNVGTSIGIAICPQDGVAATELLKKADIALYHVKKNGRGWFCRFEDGMDLAIRERRSLEHDLRMALQNRELTIEFQPLFDRDCTIASFEALVRWVHPVLGQMSPAQFIPLAEECGLIVSLGEWVLRSACAAAASWDSACRIAVNLSPAQFVRGDLPQTVRSVLEETGLAPGRLELEVTEGVMIESTEAAFNMLSQLRSFGVRLVLDDFGTGYSSLSYLHRFPFDKLKIDRSFVQALETDANARAIVSAIISMSRSLNLAVTAEGVETAEQLAYLCAQGCDELQGYLLGRPMLSGDVRAYIASVFRLKETTAPVRDADTEERQHHYRREAMLAVAAC